MGDSRAGRVHVRQVARPVRHHRDGVDPAGAGQDGVLHLGRHRDGLLPHHALLLLRAVRLQRLELSQLYHRGAPGPCS